MPMTESEFEYKLIEYLSTGQVAPVGKEGAAEGRGVYRDLKQRLWKYEAKIKTTEQLWDNFKAILERHNQNILTKPLSEQEFNQIKREIEGLNTPYQAGQFLYGLNGISQVEVDLDDGRHVFLTVFDQKQVGAGDTVYQVVNQIRREPVIAGKSPRIFDTTLLVNGLPLIQIEEKKMTRDVNEALNQMRQYIEENQYSGIYSTVQILVGMTENSIRYMANTTKDRFNKDFAFHWQRREENTPVRNWKEFADLFLSIPMAHQMATSFMILDGTPNKQSIKVMRPYQVYATQKVLDALKRTDINSGMHKIGYVWHTTGSGKTITSFKTAWLASRLPNVDKVVFLVDRIALTRQTSDSYKAYDPDAEGNVQDTENTSDLKRKLEAKDNSIIVTSVQKLDKLVNRPKFSAPDKNIVFIVDEAHRSTGGDSFKGIQKAFKKAAWVGYTGTPMFESTTEGLTSREIFGELLHAYTIRDAIADRNVLGFKVDFETTIPEDVMREDYLPQFYRNQKPDWSEAKIQKKISNMTAEDMDDAIEASFYDENEDHVRLVVADIFKKWRNRSNEGKYNALFTTHVGGGKASTPMAMMYYDEFQRVNKERAEAGLPILKVAITFSLNKTNDDNMVANNVALERAIQGYNALFDKNFGINDVAGYTQDVSERLKKTARDGKFLDLVIVVDQLLTGFDAPELNTLYVDRTLKGASLIQAYSRTNRIADMQEKPWGRIVNYRWPKNTEKLMNDALAIYAEKTSADVKVGEIILDGDGILAVDFKKLFGQVKEVVDELKVITTNFTDIPKSEGQQEHMLTLLRQYSIGVSKLKQYTIDENGEEGYDYSSPEKLIEALGMTVEEEVILTTSLANELKNRLKEKEKDPMYDIELRMAHIKDVKVDYDYLTELVEALMNQVHDKDMDSADETREKIYKFAKGLEDRIYAKAIINATEAIYQGHYTEESYPVNLSTADQVIEAANNKSVEMVLDEFRAKWGIQSIITSEELRHWLAMHTYGQSDLDDQQQLTNLLSQASQVYTTDAMDGEVKIISKMKYRNALRGEIYNLADELLRE